MISLLFLEASAALWASNTVGDTVGPLEAAGGARAATSAQEDPTLDTLCMISFVLTSTLPLIACMAVRRSALDGWEAVTPTIFWASSRMFKSTAVWTWTERLELASSV